MQTTITNYEQYSRDYRVVERALVYLEEHYPAQPSLDQVASSVGYSPYHFQRLFARWVGISPKRFLQFLTKEHAKALLESSGDILQASYQSGLSGPGRLHDLFVTCEAVTPGEYKARGAQLTIHYGFHDTPFGECLLATTPRGICGLYFVEQDQRQAVLQALEKRWSSAQLVEAPQQTSPLIARIFPLGNEIPSSPLNVYLTGTNFQIKVWEALLRIPPGRLASYDSVAAAIGRPDSARAVSRALALNPVAVIIPCHRVIRKMGAIGGYRWGTARKQALLGWEMASGAA